MQDKTLVIAPLRRFTLSRVSTVDLNGSKARVMGYLTMDVDDEYQISGAELKLYLDDKGRPKMDVLPAPTEAVILTHGMNIVPPEMDETATTYVEENAAERFAAEMAASPKPSALDIALSGMVGQHRDRTVLLGTASRAVN